MSRGKETRIDFRPDSLQRDVLGGARSALEALRAPLDDGLELDDTASAFVGSLFLIRCARNLAAIITLCESGWAPEAQTILRSMVEDMVTVAYISTQTDTLALKWLTFENRRLPDPQQVMAVFSGAELPEREPQPKYERWTRLSFNAMAERAERVVPGLQEYLSYVYPILSDRAHGNTSAGQLYIRVHPDGTVEPLCDPSNSQIAITLCNAITAGYTMAERIVALGVRVDLEPIEEAERAAYQACGLHVGLPGDALE